MDKNTLIGFILIGAVLFGFSWLNQPSPEQVDAQLRMQDSIAKIELAKEKIESTELAGSNRIANAIEISGESDSVREARLTSNFGSFGAAMLGQEEFVVLQNNLVELKISTKGGRLSYAQLKEYKTWDQQPLILFDGQDSKFDITLVTSNDRVIGTSDMYFTPIVNEQENSVVMRVNAGAGRYLDLKYTLANDSYMVDFDIQGNGLNGVLAPSTKSLEIQWMQKIRQQEKGRKFEDQLTGLYYKLSGDDVEYLSEVSDENLAVEEKLQWIGFKDKFFSTVLIAKGDFSDTKLDSKMIPTGKYLKTFNVTTSIPFDLRSNEATSFRYFIGPNSYPLLKTYNEGIASAEQPQLEKLVPLGASVFRYINQFIIIPLFDFLGGFISNYGIIILLMTFIVKMFLFPLTYKSYISSAKMRVLRPQVEAINAQYPGTDKAMERQRATMELYSKAGASPMSGCLPMLLQMPILIAMYMFFPSAIELRQQGFLWAHDLSTYDSIISWNAQIPLVSEYFGNHISLFCLLMTITNIIYTKFNMDQTNTGQQQMPGMKAMMYMMPLMFLVFFNQSAAGLSYYYFVSTLITIIQTLIFRYTINEDKLLLKLEENKKKPQKKSAFMARLEEAQRLQQEQARQKGKK
jgi:YidC/Oxa1 family membrane protein insertase